MKIVSFNKDVVYQENKPAVTLMLDNVYTKEVRIALSRHQLMKEHKAPYPIMVQVLRGVIEFGVQGKKYTLQAGDLIALDANVPHDLLATADAIVRLTLHKADTDERVKKVVE